MKKKLIKNPLSIREKNNISSRKSRSKHINMVEEILILTVQLTAENENLRRQINLEQLNIHELKEKITSKLSMSQKDKNKQSNTLNTNPNPPETTSQNFRK